MSNDETPQQANERDAALEWEADHREPEKYVPVSALLPLLQSWKDWVPSLSPNAQVRSVNNGILQGQEWAHDDLVRVVTERAVGTDLLTEEAVNVAAVREQVTNLEGRLAELREAYLKACRAKQDLSQALDEANDEIASLKREAEANRQIFRGEQDSLTRVLGYLEKIQGVMNDADQDFNFSGNYDPDDSPR